MTGRYCRVCWKDRSGLITSRRYEQNYEQERQTEQEQRPTEERDAFDPSREQWDEFTDRFDNKVTPEDLKHIMRDWTPDGAFGYVRTANSFDINETLYTPGNENKSDEELFTRRDKNGVLRDLETVRALDRTIAKGRTPETATYTRLAGSEAMRSLFGFTKEQANVILGAGSLSSGELKKLSDMFRGRMSHSRSYTSTSANPNLNVFKGKPIERRITVPKGTHAYAVSGNPHESEVIFGRGVQTELVGISVSSSGHIVLHERFVGYKKK